MSEQVFEFEGFSDDTFGEYAGSCIDFDNCADGTPISFELKTPDGVGIVVTGQYAPGDLQTWLIGVAPINEDKQVDWHMNFKNASNGYSMVLHVVAPMNTTLTCLNSGQSYCALATVSPND